MIKIGDRVRYSRAFLRSTSQLTGDVPFAQGNVVFVKSYGSMSVATIDWGNPNIPAKVATSNLQKVKGA